jgi:hypothetical protein
MNTRKIALDQLDAIIIGAGSFFMPHKNRISCAVNYNPIPVIRKNISKGINDTSSFDISG